MLIFVCQFGQCRRREEQKDVRVSFHIEHWYVFSLLLATSMNLQALYFTSAVLILTCVA